MLNIFKEITNMSIESNVDETINRVEEETSGNNSPIFHNTSNAPNSTDNEERPSCKFGRQCFRQNPRHRQDISHPGDVDYIVPDMPESIVDAPKCKYGRKCYRLNPEHFKNFEHPRNINIQQNYRKYCLQRQGIRRNSNSSFDYNFSDDDAEDPFAGDSDGSEYEPSDDE